VNRIALLCSEPLRRRMAGIGIRYLELARRLPEHGFQVVLVTAGDPAEVPSLPAGVEVRAFARGSLASLLGDCQAVVAQGQLANDVLLEVPGLPAVIDLYDPWLVENFHYLETLGLDPYRNDHATWVLQLSRGDFFLCSSEVQRTFYLGFLTAVGRVHPRRVAVDPDLEGLIAAVPFGLPAELEPHRPVLEAARPGLRRLLFGGLYDWYDPWTLLEALEILHGEGYRDWQLLFVRNPNAEGTPQRLFAQVEAHCRRRGWWGEAVAAVDWVDAERRYDLLRDVDVLVSPHRPSLETRLSLRTRFLDALAAGCPSICSAGGALSDLLEHHQAGWVVPPGDAPALAGALREVLEDPQALAARRRGAEALRQRFLWPRVLAPLVAFLRDPKQDASKEEFAFRPTTQAPSDPLAFRLGRWLRQGKG
jgi:glycosyltransferase involved in cell wall biosynthesis